MCYCNIVLCDFLAISRLIYDMPLMTSMVASVLHTFSPCSSLPTFFSGAVGGEHISELRSSRECQTLYGRGELLSWLSED